MRMVVLAAVAALSAPAAAGAADGLGGLPLARPPHATRGDGVRVGRGIVAWRPAEFAGWDEAIYLQRPDGVDKLFLRDDAPSAARLAMVEGWRRRASTASGRIRSLHVDRTGGGLAVSMAIARR